MQLNNTNIKRKIYTVSGLNADIKMLLETQFPLIWVSGEISNIRIPSSRHCYFTLKDEKSQVASVMFAAQTGKLKFNLQDGLKIRGLGRITLYEPRGTYQIIFEHIEPEGVGALQKAFEQLKKKLAEEGLFDDNFKKPIPFLPKKISIISSPTGAVIHDIIKIVERRFYNIHIEIIPVRVQGKGSEKEIRAGLKLANKLKNTDLIILARGGGSLEDLYAFNTEIVARAIFASKIPVISAIGHETDYTIADFVADLRAPTPSAAAELSVPIKIEIIERNAYVASRLHFLMNNKLENQKKALIETTKKLVTPQKHIDNLRLTIDDYTFRITRIIKNQIKVYRERLKWRTERLTSKILNPSELLKSGYSIVRSSKDNKIITSINQVKIDKKLDIVLSDGIIKALCKDIKR
jgi:exodeoxyribonuclease VII large subunit